MNSRTWETGYDCGYYEGLRNAVMFILQHCDEESFVIDKLIEWRDDAYELHKDNTRYTEEEKE
tara:strand:+ start:206 stop:394 length:189 start_codon:yes stop_codon:yes gene_type:complete